MLYGHYAGNNKSFPDFVQKEKRMDDLVESNVSKVGNVSVSFYPKEHEEPILKLEKGYFWYRGEKIEDAKNAYERFTEWLTNVERKDV